MASLPPGFKEDFFSAGDLPVHYLEGPRNGPPLVLLHGTARDRNSFSALLPQLSSRFHIFIPDLRGHGESGRDPGGYRVSQFAADISSFVRNLVPAAPAIFGHSLGGIVALTVAAECPLSAVIIGDSMMSPENLAAGIYHSLFQQLRNLLLRGGPQEQIARGIGKIQLQLPGIDEPVAIATWRGTPMPSSASGPAAPCVPILMFSEWRWTPLHTKTGTRRRFCRRFPARCFSSREIPNLTPF